MSHKVRLTDWKVSDKLDRVINDPSLSTYAAMTVKRRIMKYVPYFHGTLTASGTVGPYKVKYSTPYAHFVWAGIKYDRRGNAIGVLKYGRSKHPLATKRWSEPLVNSAEDMKALCDDIRKAIKKL